MDEDLRRLMGSRARELVRKNYDWRVVSKQYEDFYEGLAGYG